MTPTITSQDGKCKFHILSPRRINLPVEWYEVRLEAGGASRAHPHGVASWEHWTCLTGQITVEVGSGIRSAADGAGMRLGRRSQRRAGRGA